ncbi:uncharacterized protein LOC128558407 [Mercenaria mercenaria]|uniref:uncharacterized protein LOC128558407 n=1 Tax=Mercenaria mercenaria TaxID=6596 RepID=UPI00234ECF00|nr:uncharacterized protein LOC128558407 [Mercenaria mercenaria]
MDAVHSNVPMNVDDMRTIEKVFAHMDLDTKMSMNLIQISNTSRILNYVNESEFKILQEKYRTSDDGSAKNRLLQFNRFLWDIAGKLSFEQFVCVLHVSGYQNMCTILNGQRIKVRQDLEQCLKNPYRNIPTTVPKRALPYAECISMFYTGVKVQVDNNAFPNGNRLALESGISFHDQQLSTCSNSGERQLLLDKRVTLYFLLAQQYADCNERTNILKRLHDSMPHGISVDRTTFDVIYHSYKAVNWANKGNEKIASEHMAIARQASSSCLPCLPVLVSATGEHYMHSESYLHSKLTDHFQNASADYENALALVNEATEEEKNVWKYAIILKRVHLLFGIKKTFNVNDTEIRPDENSIKEARSILHSVHQFNSLKKRQRTHLYFCMARLEDLIGNKHSAVEYIKKCLAENGLFDIAEERNVTDYLKTVTKTISGAYVIY